MEAAGYQNHPKDFARLLGYLDSDLLISPTTREAAGTEAIAGEDHGGLMRSASYYQLTHDYLVPSLASGLRASSRRRIGAGLACC